jgi:hypothetical protein
MPSLLDIFVWSGLWLVGSESGQKQSVKLLLQYGLQHNSTPTTTPPPHSHTLSVYTVRLLWEGGEGQREDRGATVHKYSIVP